MTALTAFRRALCSSIATRLQDSLSGAPRDVQALRADVLALLKDVVQSSDYTEVLLHLHALLPGGDRALAAQQSLEAELCEAAEMAVDAETFEVQGHLMALPLLLTTQGLALHCPPTPQVLERLPSLLVERGFVALADDITVLPVLLGTQETGCMTHAEVLRLCELLAARDVAGALAYQLSVRDKLYPGWQNTPRGEEPMGSLGLVVAFVHTAEGDPFDMARELDYPDELTGDVDAELRQDLLETASELEAISDWPRVMVPEGADWWYAATDSAQALDRLMMAEAAVERVREACRLEVGEVLAGHQVEDAPATEMPGLEMMLARSRDGSLVGKLVWPQLRSEWPDECLESFYDFLFDSDIVPVETLSGTGAGATLH